MTGPPMLIPLDKLEPHPANANVMPEALLRKLEAHIRATGWYPPLIVRPTGVISAQHSAVSDQSAVMNDQQRLIADRESPHADRYQILDGHHRAILLRRLGHQQVRCDVWTGIDDNAAALLLLTLNRLRGEDDPARRGELLEHLSRDVPVDRLARLLPDDAERIERLIALTRPPEAILETRDPEGLPHAITFFLDAAHRRLLLARLREIDPDRTRALVKVFRLDDADDRATRIVENQFTKSPETAAL